MKIDIYKLVEFSFSSLLSFSSRSIVVMFLLVCWVHSSSNLSVKFLLVLLYGVLHFLFNFLFEDLSWFLSSHSLNFFDLFHLWDVASQFLLLLFQLVVSLLSSITQTSFNVEHQLFSLASVHASLLFSNVFSLFLYFRLHLVSVHLSLLFCSLEFLSYLLHCDWRSLGCLGCGFKLLLDLWFLSSLRFRVEVNLEGNSMGGGFFFF